MSQKRRLKWEPVAAMIALLLLGAWVVYGPTVRHDLRDDARVLRMNFASARGVLECVPPPPETDDGYTFRLLWRDGSASEVLTRDQFVSLYGEDRYLSAVDAAGNTLFQAINITSWGGLVWVGIGLLGQIAFFMRMLVQWVVSERKRESVIPEAYWYFSFFGGVALFTYFAWRQDLIGVLGQTTGVVIYARNIRLIYKNRRRERRKQAEAAMGADGAGAGKTSAASTPGVTVRSSGEKGTPQAGDRGPPEPIQAE